MIELENELEKLFQNLNIDLIERIILSEDSLTFGYRHSLISIEPKINKNFLEIKVEKFNLTRKWFITKIDWSNATTRFLKFNLDSTINNASNAKESLVNALSKTSASFQKDIHQSGEPLTFTYVDQDKKYIQVEAIPMKDNDRITWHVFCD